MDNFAIEYDKEFEWYYIYKDGVPIPMSEVREMLEKQQNQIAELKSLCKECADHFDIYRYSDIVFDFTLREKLRKQVKK